MLTDTEKMAAIAKEARRRGTSYGKLAPKLTAQDVEQIYRDFERSKRKKGTRESGDGG